MSWFNFTKQLDSMDCGPACLRMVAKYHGKTYSLEKLRERSHITREGVSLLGISDAAESIGLRTMGVKIPFEKLFNEVPLPCIAHWEQRHFVVVYEIKGKNGNEIVKVADPAHGLITYTKQEFLKAWLNKNKYDLYTKKFPFLMKNITVNFQNLGLTSDLEFAIKQYLHKNHKIFIDKIYTKDNIVAFLNRTFNDVNKFGKVIYKY